MTVEPQPATDRLLRFLRLDLPGSAASPRFLRWVVASVVAVLVSLAACAAISRVAIAIDPTLASYDHLHFGDYARLEILGVLAACIGWQIVTRLSSRARPLFFWLAVLVTIVGLAPDAWILLQGQPAGGVLALVVMHFALAVITYPALVLIAPQRASARGGGQG